MARKLTPVLKRAPDEVADVWQTALEAHGQPTGRQMEPLVTPYTTPPRSSPELRERVARTTSAAVRACTAGPSSGTR